MSLFLLVVIGIYSAAHLYVFFRIKAAFPFGAIPGAFLGLFMAAMIAAPILVRILERYGHDAPARVLSYAGYTWMGVFFLFFSLSVLIDLYRLLLSGAGMIFSLNPGYFMPSARTAFLVPLFLALAFSLYGYFEALRIRPHEVVIRTPKIPEGFSRLRIVQISDVHLGLIVRQERVDRILQVIRDAEPDILISTGDLVDGQIDSLANLADAFKEVRPRYGKFAVTGNHEFYAGLPQSLEITRRAGFTLLRGEVISIPEIITIAGIDDPAGKHMGMNPPVQETELLSGLPRDTFTLLLKHQPFVAEEAPGLYDLQLSGHTHNGQIFPFSLIVRIFFPRVTGLHDLPNGSHLYISQGTGTWGPPIRFLTQPEVTIIDLIRP